MANHFFDDVILQFKEASDRIIGVIDFDGILISCTSQDLCGSRMPDLAEAVSGGGAGPVLFDGKTAMPVGTFDEAYDYALFVDGTDDIAQSVCRIAAVALAGVKASYEEKRDRSSFIKNIITDNILPGDIYIHAKELHFLAERPRVVFLIRLTGEADASAAECLRTLFPDKLQDYIVNLNETDIAVVKQVDPGTEPSDLHVIAQSIEKTLRSELYLKCKIGIGTVSNHLRELADSCKEAQVAIEVGKVFETEKNIVSYDNLGIGRLIYQLPTTLCDIFLKEVFKKNTIDTLDQETLETINMFFENNLNVSETSRRLFVHRNTLVYRLEKIKKLTGLDLREFDHAIVFKVALMVKKYLASRDGRFI